VIAHLRFLKHTGGFLEQFQWDQVTQNKSVNQHVRDLTDKTILPRWTMLDLLSLLFIFIYIYIYIYILYICYIVWRVISDCHPVVYGLMKSIYNSCFNGRSPHCKVGLKWGSDPISGLRLDSWWRRGPFPDRHLNTLSPRSQSVMCPLNKVL